MSKKYNKIIIGLDQSYTNTGISIGADNKLIKVTSTNKFKGLKTKTQKRNYIRDVLHKILQQNVGKAKRTYIYVERVRTFSQGKKGKDGNNEQGYGLKPGYIKATGALIATIVDVAAEYGVKVYSVDTRSWKSKIVGTSKNATDDKKLETAKFVKELGFDVRKRDKDGNIKRNKKGEVVYDDDASDSACICLYGFLPMRMQNLMQED